MDTSAFTINFRDHSVAYVVNFFIFVMVLGTLGCSPMDLVSTASAVQFSTSKVTFSSVPVGATAQPIQVGVTNASSQEISIASVTVAPPFTVSSNSCGVALPAGFTCNIKIIFDPSQPGLSSTELRVASTFGDALLPVSGMGMASLSISTSQTFMRPGQQIQLTAAMNGTPTQAITWALADPSLASVTGNGILTLNTGVKAGSQVTLTATSTQYSGVMASTSILVYPVLPTLSGASPSVLPLGTSTVVTLTGTNLDSTTSLLINGLVANYTLLSPTTASVSISTTPWQQGAITVLAQGNSIDGGPSNPIAIPLAVPSVSFDVAARFLGQAGFGATLPAIQQVQQLGISGWIDAQLQTPPYDYTTQAAAHVGQWYRNTQNPTTALRQRVSLALSHVYVTGNGASCYWRNCAPLWESVLETDAFTNARQLLNDVTLSQLMGIFLDNAQNNGGATNTPNQNFAREIMQLMSIGPSKLNADGSTVVDINGQPVPTYTQANIIAMSNALSGWMFPNILYFDLTAWAPPMQMDDGWHNQDSKMILPGMALPAGQGGVADKEQVLNTLFQHPNLGPFLARRLIQALVKSNPSPTYIARMTTVFADDGTGVRGNLGALVKAILLDPEARSGDDPTSTDQSAGKLLEPVVYLSDVMNTTGTIFTDDEVAATDSSMGEQHWNEPTVFSYFDPNHTLSDGTPAPESELLSSSNITAAMLAVYGTFHQGWPGLSTDWSSSPFWNCGSVSELIDRLNHYIYHGTMALSDQNILINYAATQQWSTVNDGIPDLAYLAFSSTSYKVIR